MEFILQANDICFKEQAMLEISERRLKGAVQEVSGKASSTDNGEDQ